MDWLIFADFEVDGFHGGSESDGYKLRALRLCAAQRATGGTPWETRQLEAVARCSGVVTRYVLKFWWIIFFLFLLAFFAIINK